jgi:hypothetical protein
MSGKRAFLRQVIQKDVECVLSFECLAPREACVLVSVHVPVNPSKWLINIILKLYFKSVGVFHKAEEKPVGNFPAWNFPINGPHLVGVRDASVFASLDTESNGDQLILKASNAV